MADQHNIVGSRLAKSWTWVAGFLNTMDADPLVHTKDRISLLEDKVADLESRLQRLESSMTNNS